MVPSMQPRAQNIASRARVGFLSHRLRDEAPLVSIIVPLRNAVERLPQLLEALARQTVPAYHVEILFVDNGSNDGSIEWLKENLPLNGRLLHSPLWRSPYGARNMGIRNALAPWLAFTDSDCLPEHDWLEQALSAAGSALRMAGRIIVQCSSPKSLVEELDASRFLRQQRYVAEAFGATANLIVHRSVFEQVGLFDERLLSGGDHEFGTRAENAGVPISYEHGVIVRHPARKTLYALMRKAYRVGLGVGQVAQFHTARRAASAARVADRLALMKAVARHSARPIHHRLILVVGHVLLAVVSLLGCINGYCWAALKERTVRDVVKAWGRTRGLARRPHPRAIPRN